MLPGIVWVSSCLQLAAHACGVGAGGLNAVLGCGSLRVLDLGYEPQLSPAHAHQIAAALARPGCRLRGLTFGGELTAASTRRQGKPSVAIAATILAGAAQADELTAIGIRGMPLRPGGGGAVASLLGRRDPAAPPLKIALELCEIDPGCVAALATAIAARPTAVKELVLCERSGSIDAGACSDAGVVILAAALKGCTALRTLKLERVGIRQPHKGIAAISELIETPGIKLRRLSLSGNRASEQSLSRLAAALRHPGTVLSQLALGGCNLTDATVAPLLDALPGILPLRVLDLKGNRLRCTALKQLAAQLVPGKSGLTAIDLSGNLFASAGASVSPHPLALTHTHSHTIHTYHPVAHTLTITNHNPLPPPLPPPQVLRFIHPPSQSPALPP